MFEYLERDLRRMEEGFRVPIQLALDNDGYFDRSCSSAECRAVFKVHFEDWCTKLTDEIAYCPICRFQAESTEWNTAAQEKQIMTAALRGVKEQFDNAFSAAARRSQRSQRSQPHDGLFIEMSFTYRPSPLPVIIPAEASDVLQQQSTCEECACRYSSVGAAFFCPACGHNSAVTTFDASIDTVRKTLDTLPKIRKELIEAIDTDAAEDLARHICENGLVKLVASFQRLAQALFDNLPNRVAFGPRRNLFQNLQESDTLWRSAIGHGYSDMLTASEYSALETYFQQRHLLSHTDGMVDQGYLDRARDQRYVLGQRLVVRSQAVAGLADLVEKLADELRKRV